MKKLLAQPITENIYKQVSERVQKFIHIASRKPKLAVVLVGNNPASLIYTKRKAEMCSLLGMDHETLLFPENSSVAQLKECIFALNKNPLVDGILIQRPLPIQFNEADVLLWIAPDKDVDGFHPSNAGKLFLGLPALYPCTPAGIMNLLDYYEIPIAGKIACVVGRSSIVGKPMAALLLQANATVIQCHQQTKNLPELTRQADILVVAIGKPHFIHSEHFKQGAVVIDVGIHRHPNGKLVGDVNFEIALPIVSAITPVPGGVGPMTIAKLMENTIQAAENHLK